MSHLQMQTFQKQHIPELLEFIYDAFKANNPTMINDFKSRLFFQEETKLIAQLFIDAAEHINKREQTTTIFNSFIRHQGLIVSVVFFCDVEYYIQTIETKINDFSIGEIKDKLVQETKGVFATRTCVRKTHQSLNVLRIHFSQQMQHFVNQGYQYIYGVIHNPITFKYLQLGGAKVLKKSIKKHRDSDIEVEENAIIARCADMVKSLLGIRAKL